MSGRIWWVLQKHRLSGIFRRVYFSIKNLVIFFLKFKLIPNSESFTIYFNEMLISRVHPGFVRMLFRMVILFSAFLWRITISNGVFPSFYYIFLLDMKIFIWKWKNARKIQFPNDYSSHMQYQAVKRFCRSHLERDWTIRVATRPFRSCFV